LTLSSIAAAVLVALWAWATPFAAGSADGEPRLRVKAFAELPAPGDIALRPAAGSGKSVFLQGLLADELEQRGYRVDVAAPLVLTYNATGAFALARDEGGILILRGSVGSAGRPQGELAVTLPSFESAPVRRNYQLEARITDASGRPLWEGWSSLEAGSDEPSAAARALVAALLKELGRSAETPE